MDLTEVRKLITNVRKECPNGIPPAVATRLQLAALEVNCAILEQLREGKKWLRK